MIDWENSRTLEYDTLKKQRYFSILYGPAWYPAYLTYSLRYYQTTGGYDTFYSSEYGNQMIYYFQSIQKERYLRKQNTLDVGSLGFVLYGALRRYKSFVMNMYKMTPSQALKYFKKTKRNVSI